MYLPELKYVLPFGLLSLRKLLFQFTIWIKCQLLYSVLRDGSRSKYAPIALSCKTEEYHNYKHKRCLYSKVCPWQIWSSIPGVTLMELKHPASIKVYRIMVGLVLWQWTLQGPKLWRLPGIFWQWSLTFFICWYFLLPSLLMFTTQFLWYLTRCCCCCHHVHQSIIPKMKPDCCLNKKIIKKSSWIGHHCVMDCYFSEVLHQWNGVKAWKRWIQ